MYFKIQTTTSKIYQKCQNKHFILLYEGVTMQSRKDHLFLNAYIVLVKHIQPKYLVLTGTWAKIHFT